jgi:hypothetical protein
MRNKWILVFVLLFGIVTFVHGVVTLLNENFDGPVWPIPGWNCDGTQRVSYAVTTPKTGAYCVYMTPESDYLRTPIMANPDYISFWYKRQFVNVPTDFWVQIGYVFGGPWTSVGYFQASMDWQQAIVDLSAYTNAYVRISLLGPNSRCTAYLFVDAFYVPERRETPVELSSFTASLDHMQNQDVIRLNWTTQTETQVAGYNVFKHSEPTVSDAMQLNTSIISAHNTSTTSNYEFVDSEVENGQWYYWLQSNDISGEVELFGPISITIGDENDPGLTPGLGTSTLLKNAYPNPFQLSTVIPYQLTSKGNVKLEIYNQKGQRVWVYDRPNSDVGIYQVEWDGKDMNGRRLSAGVYLCRMSSENYISSKKLVIIK